MLDTNAIIDVLDSGPAHHAWAARQIVKAVSGEGTAVNAIIVAELCAGDRNPQSVASDLQSWGVHILDLPATAAIVCGKAYRRYALARRTSGGGDVPIMPLPDFFIGVHAEIMDWKLATRDSNQISK